MIDSVTTSLVIGNLAYAVAAAAFVVRDILWLRLLSALANAAFVTSNIVAPSGPSYAFLSRVNIEARGQFLGMICAVVLPEVNSQLVPRNHVPQCVAPLSGSPETAAKTKHDA